MDTKKITLNCNTCLGRPKGIFCDLHKTELEILDKEKNPNFFKKGQHLFLAGNPPVGLYCLHSGKIKVTKSDSEGKETIIRIVSSGGIVGHRSLFSKEPNKASAKVLEDGVVCFVSKKTVMELIQADPKLSYNIIDKISKEMGAAEDRLASMAKKSIKERFAETLLLLNESFGVREGETIKLEIKLTREELGSMIGAASENISRLISEFKSKGYLSEVGKDIYIDDVKGIESEASLGY